MFMLNCSYSNAAQFPTNTPNCPRGGEVCHYIDRCTRSGRNSIMPRLEDINYCEDMAEKLLYLASFECMCVSCGIGQSLKYLISGVA